MSINKLLFVLLVGLVFSKNIQAQSRDSLIKDNEIDVIKTFRPILSEAIKIPVNPNPEKPEIITRTFTYQIPEQQLIIQPTLYTIKPLSLGTALLPKLKNNYFKLGFGNYVSPLAEIYFNSVRNKQRQAGLFAKHFSANGDNSFNAFSDNLVYGYLKQFIGKGSYGIDALYSRNAVMKYAAINDNDKKQLVYQLYEAKGFYQNYTSDSSGLFYKMDMGYYNYLGNFGVKENDFFAKIKLGKFFNEVPFELVSGLQLNNTNKDSNSIDGSTGLKRVYFDLNPQVTLSGSDYYLKGGFNSTYVSESGGGSFHFFPKAEAGYYLIQNKLTVLGGFTGNLKPNTFRSITNENPFASAINLRNTITHFELYGEIKGQLTPMTNFSLMASTSKIENMLFYALDSISGRQVSVYDMANSTLVKFGVYLNHSFNEKFRIGIGFTKYNYKLQYQYLSNPYSRPPYELKAHATYNIGDKFLIKFDLFYMGERKGVSKNWLDPGSGFYESKISDYIDANFGIDYRYNKNLSAFISIYNIANNRYQRFNSYQVYGINAMGGFTFTF